MCLTPKIEMPTPPPPQATTVAPKKTDADIARAAEKMRQRLALSTRGFGADFKSGSVTGATGPGYEAQPLKAITLGT
jgi:hypothetical protein